MITARQSRAARALLGWTQETLADKARVSLTALKRLDPKAGSMCMRRRAIKSGGHWKPLASFFCPLTKAKECCGFMTNTSDDPHPSRRTYTPTIQPVFPRSACPASKTAADLVNRIASGE
jgi:hypothetical protein